MIAIGPVRSGSDAHTLISNVEIRNDDGTTTLANVTNLTIFLSVRDKYGSLILDNLPAVPQPETSLIPYSSWTVTAPGEALLLGEDPWRFIWTFRGPEGLLDRSIVHAETAIVQDQNE